MKRSELHALFSSLKLVQEIAGLEKELREASNTRKQEDKAFRDEIASLKQQLREALNTRKQEDKTHQEEILHLEGRLRAASENVTSLRAAMESSKSRAAEAMRKRTEQQRAQAVAAEHARFAAAAAAAGVERTRSRLRVRRAAAAAAAEAAERVALPLRRELTAAKLLTAKRRKESRARECALEREGSKLRQRCERLASRVSAFESQVMHSTEAIFRRVESFREENFTPSCAKPSV